MTTGHTPFVEHCAELLNSLGSVRSRRMFGGHGFYVDGIFIALIISERLYLKADALTVPLFEGVGCERFVYIGSGKTLTLGYFSAPEDVMDSPAAMQPWARLALAAALRARAAKPPAARPAKNARQRKGSASKAPAKL